MCPALPLYSSARSGNETIQLQQKLARVQSLLEAARKVHSTIELEEVLASVLELTVKELEASGAFLVFPEQASFGRSYGRVPDNWVTWRPETQKAEYATTTLSGEHEASAHLVVCRSEPLSMEEQDFLDGLALQSAVAVKNARQHRRLLELQRVQTDLDAARAIQQSLLPSVPPEVDGYLLSVRSTMCYEVGGDYVDIIPIGQGRLMIVVADVAGKGLPSALVSMTFRSSFRAMSGAGIPLEEMARRLNQLHWQEGLEARLRYVTAILACLDTRSHTLEAVNAGHNPAFVVHPGGLEKIGASGPPLGLLPSCEYERVTLPLLQGSRALLYTDGLTEVFQGEEMFGEERLLRCVQTSPSNTPLESIWHELERFAPRTPQSDDRTALFFERSGNGVRA